MVRVGSARIDENGKVIGGQAGDQTGQEVAVEAWYRHDKGWVVIRAKDAAVRERIAQCMEAACANDQIGYDQSTSWDLYDKSKQYGWECSKVKVPAETDCSSLVRVCVAFAIGKSLPWFSTLNEVSVLSQTGLFDVLTDVRYAQSSDYLKRGDILCTKTQGHTVVVLDDGTQIAENGTQPATDTSQGNTTYCGTGIGTAVAQQAMHVRSGAGTNHASLAIILAGTAVEVLSAEGGWYKIVWPGEACGYAFTKAGSGYYSYSANANAQVINLGDKVQFTGNKQYMSAWADKPITAVPEVATVTSICESGKHQYHIIGDNVYGWVNREDIVRK
jgi:hypothetical protein